MDRRQFVRLAPMAVGGFWLLSSFGEDEAKATNSSVGRGGVVFVGGWIISQLIDGLLRAYDIDISGETAEAVKRRFRERREIYQSVGYPPGTLSEPSTCRCSTDSESGTLQLLEAGCKAGLSKRTRYFTPGHLLWAAVDGNQEIPADTPRATLVQCLDGQRCGYPVRPWRSPLSDHKKNYRVIEQQFQRGKATLIIDRTYRKGVEGIYERNKDLEVWDTD